MRHLIYMKMIHMLPLPFRHKLNADNKRYCAEYHAPLRQYNELVADYLIEKSKEEPIHRCYIESHYGGQLPKRVMKENMLWIARKLQYNGTAIMPTEHVIFALINQLMASLPIEGYNRMMSACQKMKIKDALPMFKEVFGSELPEAYAQLEDVCKGEKTFNITRLRDKQMALNIEDSLEENESGVLLTGDKHNVDALLKELGSDIICKLPRI
jgi:hypothetical protein